MTTSSQQLKSIAPEALELFRSSAKDSTVKMARNAVTHSGIHAAALDRDTVIATPTVVSHKLDNWAVTSQLKSGRCWLFSSLNFLRSTARQKLGVKNFEFSQNYPLFWDKFERANFFLESMIATSDEPLDSQLPQFLLADVMGDGGQWDMAVSIYQKYGVVPKEAMPETESSGNTAPMNSQLKALLRRSALEMRELVAQGASAAELEDAKNAVLKEFWRILVIALGEPPVNFEWEWRDDEGEFHRDGAMTPAQFYDTYVGIDLSDYVCLVDDPRREHPKGHALTIEHLGNIVGGREIRYINADPSEMGRIASQIIAEGSPVWFGADISKQHDRNSGLIAGNLYDFSGLFGVDLKMTKEQRVISGDSAMNHAMLFTGVDIAEDGTPRRWRVENSWGEKPGEKGFFTMDAKWFNEYVFEVVVPISSLPDSLRPALTEQPLALPAWDPMGTLA